MNILPSRLQTGALAPAQVSWRRSPTEVSPREEGAAATVHPARSRGSRAPMGCAVCAFPRYGESAPVALVGWPGASLDLGRQASILPRPLDPCATLGRLPPAGGRLT